MDQYLEVKSPAGPVKLAADTPKLPTTRSNCASVSDENLRKILEPVLGNDPRKWENLDATRRDDLEKAYRRANCIDPSMPISVEIERFASVKGIEQRVVFGVGKENQRSYNDIVAPLKPDVDFMADSPTAINFQKYQGYAAKGGQLVSELASDNPEIMKAIRTGKALKKQDDFVTAVGEKIGITKKITYELHSSTRDGQIGIVFRDSETNGMIATVEIDKTNKATVQYVVSKIPLGEPPPPKLETDESAVG